LSHLNWLFSGKGVAEAQTSSHLPQKLSRIGANLLRCLAVQMTIGSLREGKRQDGSPSLRASVSAADRGPIVGCDCDRHAGRP
jgi:hypothetical protein